MRAFRLVEIRPVNYTAFDSGSLRAEGRQDMRGTRAGCSLALLLGVFCPLRADLHFPQPIVKLAEVGTGQSLHHRFSFTNQGPSPIVISRLEAMCGCMTPRLEKQHFQPGESGSF